MKLEAQGLYSLLSDKNTKVIARTPKGNPIYPISGGCTVLTMPFSEQVDPVTGEKTALSWKVIDCGDPTCPLSGVPTIDPNKSLSPDPKPVSNSKP